MVAMVWIYTEMTGETNNINYNIHYDNGHKKDHDWAEFVFESLTKTWEKEGEYRQQIEKHWNQRFGTNKNGKSGGNLS